MCQGRAPGEHNEATERRIRICIKEYDEINKYCTDKNIDWFASAWDLNSLKFLDKYKLKYNKIASAMIIDTNFLEEVAKRKNIHLYLQVCLQKKILMKR